MSECSVVKVWRGRLQQRLPTKVLRTVMPMIYSSLITCTEQTSCFTLRAAVSWFVTLFGVTGGYRCFGERRCIHLQDETVIASMGQEVPTLYWTLTTLCHSHSLRHIFIGRLGTHLCLGLLVVSSYIQIHILEYLFPPCHCYISRTSQTVSLSHTTRTTNYDAAHYQLSYMLLLLHLCYIQIISSEFCSVLLSLYVLPCWYERPCSPLALYRRDNISKNKKCDKGKKSQQQQRQSRNPFLKWYSARFDSWSLSHTSRAYNTWQQLR